MEATFEGKVYFFVLVCFNASLLSKTQHKLQLAAAAAAVGGSSDLNLRRSHHNGNLQAPSCDQLASLTA